MKRGRTLNPSGGNSQGQVREIGKWPTAKERFHSTLVRGSTAQIETSWISVSGHVARYGAVKTRFESSTGTQPAELLEGELVAQ